MVPTHFFNSKREPRQSQTRPGFDWPKLRKAIEFYEREHLRYLPAGWGHKKPSVQWEKFQHSAPTIEEKFHWFHEGKPTNIGTLCGPKCTINRTFELTFSLTTLPYYHS